MSPRRHKPQAPSIDINRLRGALGGPGMDPRPWVAICRVDDDPLAVDVTPTAVWLDCAVVDTDMRIRPRWVSGLTKDTAGGWRGVWLPPPHPGAEVIVVCHDGDPAAAVAIATLPVGDLADPTTHFPAEVMAEPNAVHIIGATGRVLLTSEISIAEKAPRVELGAENLGALDGVVHGSGVDPASGLTYTALGNTSAVVWVKK